MMPVPVDYAIFNSKNKAKASASSNKTDTNAKKPAVTPTPPKKKRLTPLEQVEEESLLEIVDARERIWKTKQDALKKAQKELKKKQDEVKQMEEAVKQQQTDTEAALQKKREATKQLKTLHRKWATTVTQIEKAVAKAEEKATKKRLKEEDVEDDNSKPTKKRRKSLTGAKKSSNKKKASEDSESEEESDREEYHSCDEDSDWEGAKWSRKTSAAAASTPVTAPAYPSEEKRWTFYEGHTHTRPQQPSEPPTWKPSGDRKTRRKVQEWECTTCTLKNKMSLKKCEVCAAVKPNYS